MRGHQVALGDGALDVEAQLGELARKVLYELNERVKPVGGLGVVLDVVRSAVLLYRLCWPLLVKRRFEVGEHRLFVLLGVGHGSSFQSGATLYTPLLPNLTVNLNFREHPLSATR